MTADTSVDDRQPSTSTRGRGRQVLWLLPMLGSALFGCALIWTASFPGIPFVGAGLTFLFGWVAALSWFAWLFSEVRGSRRMVAIVVSAALVLCSVGLTAAGLPIRARFALSADAFAAVVADADAHPATLTRPDTVAAGEWDPDAFPIRCPTTIGQFRISGCSVIGPGDPSQGAGRGYLFIQKWNAVTDDSAIVYLPQGPTRWAWEAPRHLTGSWYGATCGC